MAKFRLSDLWWDDRSFGGRVALWWARRKNTRLHGRRSYTRKPMTYDLVVVGYSNGLWWVLKTLIKIAVGLFAVASLSLIALLIVVAV